MVKLKDIVDEILNSSKIKEIVDLPPPQSFDKPAPAIVQPANTDRQQKLDFLTVVACLILEAGGEGKDGMQAVMNVIQNRAHSNKISDFTKIVLKRKQFSAFDSYTVTNKDSLEYLILKATKHPRWNDAIEIVKQAKSGTLPDITGGADHYINPKLANPPWAKNLQKTKTLGNHLFLTSKQKLSEAIDHSINERIAYLESLLDAHSKFNECTDDNGSQYLKRARRFESKWNRAPLRLSEVDVIKNEIKELKRKKYNVLLGKKKVSRVI